MAEDRVCRACKVNPCAPGAVSCEDCFGMPEARNPELVALGLFDAPEHAPAPLKPTSEIPERKK
jgi:hypothetical protein